LTLLPASATEREGIAFALFACALFYGDLFIGVTVPAAILILPIVALLRMSSRGRRRLPLPAGLLFLGAPAVAVVLQAILGVGPRGKTDLVVYLPLVYAVSTLLALWGARPSDHHLHRGLVAGGLLSAAILLAAFVYADPASYLVPGQNPMVAEKKDDEARAAIRREPGVTPPREPAIVHESSSRRAYYDLKERVRTPLGRSNYLAVMFVFLFNVMLYQRSWWAVVFGGLVLATLSRSGVAFLVVSLMLWAAHGRGKLRLVILISAVAAAAGWILAAVFWNQLRTIPGLETVAARLWFQGTSVTPIAASPLIGLPRSEILRQFAYPLTWNPHNSILHLTVLFGLLGTLGYAAYMTVVVKAVFERARESALWSGIAAGLALALAWSAIEIVALTPAFEMLVAAIYCAACGAATPDSSRLASSAKGFSSALGP
jgi:hypothetical protein